MLIGYLVVGVGEDGVMIDCKMGDSLSWYGAVASG